ncbi:hypothetical protein Xsto_00264 [Xenorhabdus stockiae]|uniref:Lipoprotein n=1 Tax=Xenorhabdus stockiae TaxID=351614 RepID=A0A2D0KVN2_9GAMM|nr:hypothetical protein [Xenorhabdus stockiae]PHM67385.1 hypothetical protein Xsto_00264 [Xenorhabdus stockiae]
MNKNIDIGYVKLLWLYILCQFLIGCDNSNANFDNSEPSEIQIIKGIQNHFDLNAIDNRVQEMQIFLNSVKKLDDCEWLETEATKIRCPVDIIVSMQLSSRTISRQFKIRHKVHLREDNGKLIVDEKLKTKIRQMIITNGVNAKM